MYRRTLYIACQCLGVLLGLLMSSDVRGAASKLTLGGLDIPFMVGEGW